MRKRDEVILWPVYFDSTKTKGEGRKVPKRIGVSSPTLGSLERSLQHLGLEYESVPDAAHPRFPWIKSGFLLVKRKGSKNSILKEVGKELARPSV